MTTSLPPPRYPAVRVIVASANPLALVAAVREALRLARVGRDEIGRFTEQALARGEGAEAVCQEWVEFERRRTHPVPGSGPSDGVAGGGPSYA